MPSGVRGAIWLEPALVIEAGLTGWTRGAHQAMKDSRGLGEVVNGHVQVHLGEMALVDGSCLTPARGETAAVLHNCVSRYGENRSHYP